MTFPNPRSWDLSTDVHHLNHAAVGATPNAVKDLCTEMRARARKYPEAFLNREVPRLLEDARSIAARYCGADVDGFALVPSSLFGIGCALRAIQFLKDDEIVVSNHTYEPIARACEGLMQRIGGRLKVVHLPTNYGKAQLLEALLGIISSRTRLAIVDHVTSPMGLVLPVEEICQSLKRAGVISIVDAAHAPGLLPPNVSSLGMDFWVGSFHKWLSARK